MLRASGERNCGVGVVEIDEPYQDIIDDVEAVIKDDLRLNHRLNTGVPYIEIIEQPAQKALRFRYECEGRSAGSIPGIHSTPENKTHPMIKLCNYKGRAVVVVSCVTTDEPHRPHPHNLVGKEGCKKGVCTVHINPETMTCSFPNLGIQCVKRRDIDEALKQRESILVDPFKTGFEHRHLANSVNLNTIRLAFQVFTEGPESGKFTKEVAAVVSHPIYDKKAMSDLIITKLSACSAPVSGGIEIILLCDRVAKDNIEVRFFEEKDGVECWQEFGDFHPADVHKQVAICFRTPRYKDQNVQHPVKVFIELKRKKDGATSLPREFQFTPIDRDPDGLRHKKLKLDAGVLNRYALTGQIESEIQVRNIKTASRRAQDLEINAASNVLSASLASSAYTVPNKSLLYNSPLYANVATVPTSNQPVPQYSTRTEIAHLCDSSAAQVISDPPPYQPPQVLNPSPTYNQQHRVMLTAASVNFNPVSAEPSTSAFKQESVTSTVHNLPKLEPDNSVDEHISERLSSLDLGVNVDGAEMSLPLSDINFSLFGSHLSENMSLSALMDGDVNQVNNNLNVQTSSQNTGRSNGATIVDTDRFINENCSDGDNMLTSMNADSFSGVKNELEALNKLGMNIGNKSMTSS